MLMAMPRAVRCGPPIVRFREGGHGGSTTRMRRFEPSIIAALVRSKAAVPFSAKTGHYVASGGRRRRVGNGSSAQSLTPTNRRCGEATMQPVKTYAGV